MTTRFWVRSGAFASDWLGRNYHSTAFCNAQLALVVVRDFDADLTGVVDELVTLAAVAATILIVLWRVMRMKMTILMALHFYLWSGGKVRIVQLHRISARD